MKEGVKNGGIRFAIKDLSYSDFSADRDNNCAVYLGNNI